MFSSQEIIQNKKTTENNCTTEINKVNLNCTTEQLLEQSNKNHLAAKQVDLIIKDFTHLIEGGWEKYHYKMVYRIGEYKYRELARTAEQEGKNPARYFSWLLKQEVSNG